MFMGYLLTRFGSDDKICRGCCSRPDPKTKKCTFQMHIRITCDIVRYKIDGKHITYIGNVNAIC